MAPIVPTDSGRTSQLWSYIMAPVTHHDFDHTSNSGRTSRLWPHIPTLIARPNSGRTSRLWSHITASVVHPNSDHTSQFWSHPSTSVVCPDSSHTSRLRSYIMASDVCPDSDPTSQLRSYIPTLVACHDSSHTCNTPCYGSPNLSLITVISGLVMHYVLELINSESSQSDFWVNLNLNRQIQTNRFLVWTLNLYPWIGLDTRWKPQPLLQISSKFKVPGWNYSKFSQIQT
jgi:hypothetical protein